MAAVVATHSVFERRCDPESEKLQFIAHYLPFNHQGLYHQVWKTTQIGNIYGSLGLFSIPELTIGEVDFLQWKHGRPWSTYFYP